MKTIEALIINCTLKKSPGTSNTEALITKGVEILNQLGVNTEVIRAVDYSIAPGVSSYEGEGDEWPHILDKIRKCDIFIIGTPIWVGHTCSVVQRIIERMDAVFHEKEMMDPVNGQFFTYNKVAGVIITGNEDGAHSVAAHVLWTMQEMGFTVPPNVNAYWVGEAGPGPSYIEAGGESKIYPNKTIRFTMHNLVYFARLLKANPITTNLKQLSEEAQQASEKSKQTK